MRSLVLAGIDAGRPRAGPETMHIDVTNSCNANCLTCWDHSPLLERPRPPEWKARRIESAFVEDLLDDVLDLGGLRSVILSGMGEPFTHPEIGRLITAVKSRGLRLTIISNLLAAGEDKLRQAAALGVDEFLVSIHAATSETYRALHPSFDASAWSGLIRRLDLLAEAGVACKHVHAICAPNASELPAMIALARERGAAGISFKLASLGGGTETCRIDEKQRRRLIEKTVPEAIAMSARLGIRGNLEVFARQLAAAGAAGRSEAATAPIAETGCFMGYAYARVTVEGRALFCCDTEMVVGSLGPGLRFSELWHSPKWESLRARLREGLYFPGCERCGKFAQNAKLGREFQAAYGRARFEAVTGRGGGEHTACP